MIKRYCEGKVRHEAAARFLFKLARVFCAPQFVSRYIATIGVDFGVRPVMIDDLEVKVNFWDLFGHPEFFQVRNEFYKDTQAVCSAFGSGPSRVLLSDAHTLA